MTTLTYQHVVTPSGDDAPHEDFHLLRDGQPTGLGYFLDPAPNQPLNTFSMQVDGGKVQRIAISRFDDDKDRYMLVHVLSGMTFHFYFFEEKQVKAHAEAILAIGLDWTQPVETLQQHPLWAEMGRRNRESIARILGRK